MHLIPCTACHYCTDGCPKRISIPDLFSCLNAKQIYHDWNADYYYNEVFTQNHGKASDCIKCGKCERACPQHLPMYLPVLLGSARAAVIDLLSPLASFVITSAVSYPMPAAAHLPFMMAELCGRGFSLLSVTFFTFYSLYRRCDLG